MWDNSPVPSICSEDVGIGWGEKKERGGGGRMRKQQKAHLPIRFMRRMRIA